MEPITPTKNATKDAVRSLLRKGYTRTEVAAMLSVSERTVANWIAGTNVPHRRSFADLTTLAEKKGAAS